MVSIRFKRGDSFILEGVVSDGVTPVDLTSWQVKAQIRRDGLFVAELDVTFPSRPTGVYRLSAAPAATAAWPSGKLQADVEYTTASGQVVSTETFEIDCLAGVTRA